MIKRFLVSIFNAMKKITSNQTLVTVVKRDVSQLIEFVITRNYSGAAILVVNDLNTFNTAEVIQHARQAGLDTADFAPIAGHINSQLNDLPADKLTLQLEEKARESIAFVQEIVNAKQITQTGTAFQ